MSQSSANRPNESTVSGASDAKAGANAAGRQEPIRFEDLDAEGYGYWPTEAQEAIARRDNALVYIVKHPNGVGDHHPSAVARAALEGRSIPNV